MIRWVCIVPASDKDRYANVGLEHRCRSLRHMHYSRGKVERLVKAGEMAWVGKHHKIAMYKRHLSWAKVYNRNFVGEVFTAGMQLISGNRR
jgi:hypothetical protein